MNQVACQAEPIFSEVWCAAAHEVSIEEMSLAVVSLECIATSSDISGYEWLGLIPGVALAPGMILLAFGSRWDSNL